MGRLNKSGKYINKESYEYYTKSFNANKSYYKRHGYDIPLKMTRKEWEFKKESTGLDNADIVYFEFHTMSKESARQASELFKEAGLKPDKQTRGKILRGEKLDKEYYDVIKNMYHDLLASGMSSREAKDSISGLYYGS